MVGETSAARRVVVLEGRPGDWLPAGFEIVAQRGDGLAVRLAAAFADVGAPALLIGMDTPQLDARLLGRGLALLADSEHDAVLGPTYDGGYWAIGLARADPRVFDAIPMSSPDTCAAQRERLAELGLRVGELPKLRDVDRIEDARAVAASCPGGIFARTLARFAAPPANGSRPPAPRAE